MQHTHKIYKGKDGRWRTYVYDDEGRRMMITASDRMKLEKKLAEIYTVEDDVTMEGLLNDWLAYKALHVAPNSVTRIRNTWNRYYAGTEIATKPISQLRKIDVDTFIHATIQEYELTRKEFGNFITILNQLLDYAVDLEIVERNVRRDVRVSRHLLKPDVKHDDREQVYSVEEFSQLRKMVINDFENNVYPVNNLLPLACLFMFYSGLRISELVVLKWVDVYGDILHVRRMYRHSTKEILQDTKGAFGEREVPLIPYAQEILSLCQSKQKEKRVKTEYIFSMSKKPLSYSAVQKIFYKYSHKISGLPKSSHKARKTFVSTLIDAGMNINTVRQIAGHVDEVTTLHNYTFDRSSNDEKLDAITTALSPKSYPKSSK